MQNALLCTVGVYFKGFAGSLSSSNVMTPPCSSKFHLLSIEVIQLVLSYCQVNDATMVSRRKYSKLCDSEFLDCTPTSFCVASRLSVSFYRIARSMIYKNVHIEIPVYSKSLLQNAESDVDGFDADEHSFLDEPPTCDRDVVIGSFTPHLQDLCDIFFLNDSIVYDIHHVKVSFKRYEFIEEFDPAEHATDSDPTVSMLQYLARHQKIRSISIRGITHAVEDTERVDGMERERDGMDWRTLPSEMQCSLSHLLQCPTLEKVELINWSHFPLSRLWLNGERISQPHYSLYPIPRPKNIAFTLHHVSDDPSLADPTPLVPTMEQPELLSILPPNPISITSLRLVQPTVGWSHTTACLLGTIVSRGVVESQHLQPRGKVAHPARLQEIRDLAIAIKDPRDGCIAMLLAECGANLETLELDVRSGWMRSLRKADDLTQLPTLDLSHLHSLRQLTFRISPETPIAWISALLKTLPPRDDAVHTSLLMSSPKLSSPQPLSISIYLDTRKYLKKPDPQRIYNIRSALSGLNWVLFVDSVLSLQGTRSAPSSPWSARSCLSDNGSQALSPLPITTALSNGEDITNGSATAIASPTEHKFDVLPSKSVHFGGGILSRQLSASSVSTKIDSPTEAAFSGLSVCLGIEVSSTKLGKKIYKVLDRDTPLVTLSSMGALDVFVVQPEDD